jgi:cytochrome P450
MLATLRRWLRRLAGAAAVPAGAAPPPCDRFPVDALRGTWTDRVLSSIVNRAARFPCRECLLGLLRWLCPNVSLFGCVIVLRDEDVRDVLLHDREFPVPWDERMVNLTGAENFVLGMKADAEYFRNYAQLAQAFKRDDIGLVADQARRATQTILQTRARVDPATGKARIDAVRELMWGVPAQLCEDYYGITIADKFHFAAWSVAMSWYLFGSCKNDLVPTPLIWNLAHMAADCFRDTIRIAMGNARQGRSPGPVLPRMIEMQARDPTLTNEVIEADLFGMVLGFIPTDLLAGSHMLDTLLSFPEFMQRARDAAFADDDDLLWRCLQEALRFRHFNLGAFRICGPRGYTLAAGTRREKRLAPGTRILASTQSAMFDSRRIVQPKVFNPDRPEEDYMVFGFGQHWCIGKHIAIAQLTQTFKILLTRKGLQRARGASGTLKFYTVYPANLTVEFTP